MSGTLYIVGTPLGNLGDMSPRAVETLSQVDFIAAEDTRVTVKLLNHFGIKKPMISYFEHNRREKGEVIVDRIISGESCALVTDAGMPAVSDPGEDLVRLCHENGIIVQSVPGPTAFATAVAMSGMNVGRFTFEGFLSQNKSERRAHHPSIVSAPFTALIVPSHPLKSFYKSFQTPDSSIPLSIHPAKLFLFHFSPSAPLNFRLPRLHQRLSGDSGTSQST